MKISLDYNDSNPEHEEFSLQWPSPLTLEKDRLCPACHHAVPEENRFCGHCGERMPQDRDCPHCGQSIIEGDCFCGNCGAATLLVSDADPKSASAPVESPPAHFPAHSPAGHTTPAADRGTLLDHFRALMPAFPANKSERAAAHTNGERREVTVLILDVTNFTAASHRMDSEDIYLIIDEAMRLLVRIIHKYEGTVDKFTGDGLIALFGAPITHENDPERALRTSLEMLQVLQPLRQRTMTQHNFDFQVRIGINTGLAIAGSLGNNLHMEYTVIGDTVTMASRLEAAAHPGSVLVSFSTYQRTRPLFNFVTLPPMTMQGFPETVPTYRPIQVREQPGSVRGLPGMRVQMIGRNDDLARLHFALEVVKKERHHRISLITGEAGLGKSRLVAEFCESLAKQGIRYFQGNALAYARSRPLWIVAEILRDMAEISEVDTVEFQIERLREFIARQKLNEAEVLPVLLHVLELKQLDISEARALEDSAPENFQARLHTILHQVLLSFQDAPFVLIFDDLHWVDPLSCRFLISLLAASEQLPVHLILVSRDFQGLAPICPLIDTCVTYTNAFDNIHMRALSTDESRLLVNQLLWRVPPDGEELNQVIAARAEGNPFYTEEIVRMLIDEGGIVDSDDEWKATNRVRDLLRTVPGSLSGLILARFDQLSPELRLTLQLAAVLGRTFPARLLEKLHHGTQHSLLSNLKDLTNRQFLQENENSAEQCFSFRHTLIQEAVYSTLLKRERRRLHGLVAEVIKDTNFWLPEEQTQALAYHYSESSAPDKAIPYLIAKTEPATQRISLTSSSNQPTPSHHAPFA